MWAWMACSSSPSVERVGFWFVTRLAKENAFESGDFMMVPPNRVLRQDQQQVVPDPLCLVWACRRARSTATTLFLVHTHIAQDARFSHIDEATERRMAPHVMSLSGSRYFGAVVVAPSEYCARLWRPEDVELGTPTAIDIRD